MTSLGPPLRWSALLTGLPVPERGSPSRASPSQSPKPSFSGVRLSPRLAELPPAALEAGVPAREEEAQGGSPSAEEMDTLETAASCRWPTLSAAFARMSRTSSATLPESLSAWRCWISFSKAAQPLSSSPRCESAWGAASLSAGRLTSCPAVLALSASRTFQTERQKTESSSMRCRSALRWTLLLTSWKSSLASLSAGAAAGRRPDALAACALFMKSLQA
mmetsp:Transcript_91555/g.222373  ORF Transcript_91555/g.222373 Transcript_91555/m.222373 type:complete len:220 (+) Transcript_91555:996-1655(+)